MKRAWWFIASLALLAPTSSLADTRGGFLMTMGRDTIAIERFERGDTRIIGTVLFKLASLRTDYVIELRGDATVQTMLVDARKGSDSPDAPARQSATMAFADDSVVTTMKPGRRDAFATMPRALPYLNPSVLLFEQAVRRARVIGGVRAIVPLFMVSGGQTFECLVTRAGADSVVLMLGGLDVRLAVDADDNVTGGRIPAQGVLFARLDEVPEAALVQPRPDYSAPVDAPYTSGDVLVRTRGGFDLAGTLTRPKNLRGRLPVAVLITGSGRQDRDESLPLLRGYRPFRQIAESLATRGIATLRLDDRGFGQSRGDASRATTEDFANDIEDAVRWLRARREIDSTRVALVGHSEGGIIAPMLAARDPRLRAIVLMAGTAEKGRKVLEYQRRQAIDRLGLKGARRDSLIAASDANADTVSASNPWLAWFVDYDPIPALRGLRLPVLILQGETDRQVTAEQAKVIERTLKANGNKDVTRRSFADTNHLFVPDSSGDPEGYAALPDPNVRPEVLNALSDWLALKLQKPPAKK